MEISRFVGFNQFFNEKFRAEASTWHSRIRTLFLSFARDRHPSGNEHHPRRIVMCRANMKCEGR